MWVVLGGAGPIAPRESPQKPSVKPEPNEYIWWTGPEVLWLCIMLSNHYIGRQWRWFRL